MFTDIYEPEDILRVVDRMKAAARDINREGGMKTIVIGMPNTGKSSMLNVIRRHATERKCIPFAREMAKYRESGKDIESSGAYASDIKCD